MTIEKEETIGDYRFRNVGGNHICVFLHPDKFTNSCLTITTSGVAKKTYITIPYFHRINKLVILHMDSSYNDGSYASTVDMKMEAGKSSLGLAKFKDDFYYDDEITDPTIIEKFGEGFEYEPRTWTLAITSQATDLFLIILYIQKLEETRE